MPLSRRLGRPLLGPVPGVPGFWVAAGFCAHGLAGAGGGSLDVIGPPVDRHGEADACCRRVALFPEGAEAVRERPDRFEFRRCLPFLFLIFPFLILSLFRSLEYE